MLYWQHITADSASSVLEGVRLAQDEHFKAFMEVANAKDEFLSPDFMPEFLQGSFLVHKSAPRLLIALHGVPDYWPDAIHMVGSWSLTVSEPVLKAPMISALETRIS